MATQIDDDETQVRVHVEAKRGLDTPYTDSCVSLTYTDVPSDQRNSIISPVVPVTEKENGVLATDIEAPLMPQLVHSDNEDDIRIKTQQRVLPTGITKSTMQRLRTISVMSTESYVSVVEYSVDADEPSTSGPDGGYSWVVMVAAFCAMCTVGFFGHAFSVLYVALVDHFQADRGVVGWIGSVFLSAGSLLGVFLGALVQMYGERRISQLGILLGAIGFSSSSLLVNIPYMYITYGLMGGIGYSATFLSSIVVVQRYFTKNRALAVGIAASGLSCGGITSSYTIDRLLQTYGLSGTLLLMCGIWIQAFIFTSFYRPLPSDSNSTKGHSIKNVLADLTDFKVLKNRNLILYLVGCFFIFIGVMGFSCHYTSRLLYIGIERPTVILLQTMFACGMATGRLVFSFVGNIKKLDVVIMQTILSGVCGIFDISFGLADDVISAAVCGIAFSFVLGGFYCLIPTVLVTLAGLKYVAKVMGYFHMVTALGILIAIPLAGFVFDVTQNYDIPYLVVGSIHLLGVSLHVVLVVFRWQEGRKRTGK